MEISRKFLFLNLHYCITSCCLWAFGGSSYQVGEIKGQKTSYPLLKPLPGFLSPITMLISAWTLPIGKSQAPLQLGEQRGKEDYDLEARWKKQVEFAAAAGGVGMALAGPVIWPKWQQRWGSPSPFCCTNFSRLTREPCSIAGTWAALKNLDWATLKAVYTQHSASSPALRAYLQELFVEPEETSRCTCTVSAPE